MIDTIVGSYRIVEALSEGGMGAVYRAEHTLIGRIAAVKVLHPEMCANKDIVKRFFNEAKATTAIKHPGIVEIFDFGYMPSGHAFLVMEFLDGITLTERIRRRGPIPEGEAAMVLRSVCSALAAAHRKGIVHRDLKPDNIFMVPDADAPLGERCKLLDFGIAKLTDIGLAGSATKTGAVLGTPRYMSPEQCRGTGVVDHRADLYSIGCILYELVAGRPPFMHPGAGELLGAHVFMEPEPPSVHAPGITAEMETLIMALLSKQPDRRVQTAHDLGGYLAQIAQRDGWTPPVEPERHSVPFLTAPSAPTRDGRVPTPTPGFTPVFKTPVPLTPYEAAPTTVDQNPTTLSSAVGQHAAVAPRRPLARVLLLSLGALAVGGVIAVAVYGGKRAASDGEITPATTPAPSTAAPPATATPAPEAAPPPATATTAPPLATPPATATLDPTPPTPAPPPATTRSTPATTRSAPTAATPARTPPARTRPTAARPAAATPPPTTTPGTKPAEPAPSRPLIEDDL